MQCSLDRLIAPSFYKVHNSIEDYTHFWLCGGRGSTKSSFVSVEIILGIMKNADTNAVVLRKVGAYLKDSVFSQLEWAIEKLGVSDMWDIKASVPEIVYKKTGQKILFRGARKGPDSIEYGIRFLQSLEKIVIDSERCPNVAREFSEYELERDTDGEFKSVYPDKNNHTIDAVRYALEDEITKKKARVIKRSELDL